MISHLDTTEQYAASLRRVCTASANEDDSKWIARSADTLFSQDIEECTKVTDSDLRIFIFRHACGRDAQSPDTRIVLCNRLLECRRIGQEVLVLDRGKLGMRGGSVVG